MYNRRLKLYLKYPRKNSCSMKRFFLPILATLAFPNAVNAEVPFEIHSRCIYANDYLGCVEANKLENFSKNKNEEIFIYQNPFYSSRSCRDEALDQGLDPELVCPSCRSGIPISDYDDEASTNGECVLTSEQEEWQWKKIGCGFLGIAFMNPQYIGNAFNDEVQTCFD